MKLTDYGPWVRVTAYDKSDPKSEVGRQFWFQGDSVPESFFEDFGGNYQFLLAFFNYSCEPIRYEFR
jgi:hypothetical protein